MRFHTKNGGYFSSELVPNYKYCLLSGMALAKTGELFSNGNVYSALLSNIWEVFERQGISAVSENLNYFIFV